MKQMLQRPINHCILQPCMGYSKLVHNYRHLTRFSILTYFESNVRMHQSKLIVDVIITLIIGRYINVART